jgi:hypothetical protein
MSSNDSQETEHVIYGEIQCFVYIFSQSFATAVQFPEMMLLHPRQPPTFAPE